MLTRRIRWVLASIAVALLGLSTLVAPASAQVGAPSDPGFVYGPVLVGTPPPKPSGDPPPGVDPQAWEKLKFRWDNPDPRVRLSIYQKVYFGAYPNLIGKKIVVHHAIEQQVLHKYPGLFTPQEIHSLDNLRGIPMGRVNNKMHLSLIRKLWKHFYDRYPPGKATKEDFYRWRHRIDLQLRGFFLNEAGSFSAEQAKQRYESVRKIGEAVFNPDNEPIDSWDGFCVRRGNAACTEARANGLTNAVAAAVSAPGGIDFSTLELRYLSDSGSTSGSHTIDYAFTARRATGRSPQGLSDGIARIKSASDAFFVWLALPKSAFWVNLNPNEPDRIIEREFGRTEAGRVLLEADLQLKKTVAKLIDPRTARGKAFWNGLRGRQKCLSMRQWIVPGPATVRVTEDQLFILDAPLQVKMETEYLQERGNRQFRSCRSESEEVEEHNEAWYARKILPLVERAVNRAPEYADLRRVYLSRVAAEWIRERSESRVTAYDSLIDSGNIDRWAARTNWTPRQTFDRYVESYTKGEFKVTQRTRRGRYIYTNVYVFGGVDFSNVPQRVVSDAEFAQRWPGLKRTVSASLERATSAQGSDQIWVGGDTVAEVSSPGPDSTPDARAGDGSDRALGDRLAPWVAIALLVAIIAIPVVGWRLRRSSR